ncbi:MAG: phosphodiester glycosidase family protein [Solirubrobacterales bacterium]
MKRTLRACAAVLAAFFLLLQSAPPPGQAEIAFDRGVIYWSFPQKVAGNKTANVYVVKANLRDPRVQAMIAYPKAGLGSAAALTAIARENQATAGINGGFFIPNKKIYPVDTMIADGTLVSRGFTNLPSFGITSDRKAFIEPYTAWVVVTLCKSFTQFRVEGVNHPNKGIGITLYTPAFGPMTNKSFPASDYVIERVNNKLIVTAVYEGGTSIPPNGYILSFHGVTRNIVRDLKVGDEVDVQTYLPPTPKNVKDLIASGPILLRKGYKVPIKLDFLQAKQLSKRNPRSAVGITKDGWLLLVAVDGRLKKSAGMTYPELASLMAELGAQDAIALDGGGSTTLYGGGSVLNHPSGGKQRAVANAILVRSQIPVLADGVPYYSDPKPVAVGAQVYLPARAILNHYGWTSEFNAATGALFAVCPDRSFSLTAGQNPDSPVTLVDRPYTANGDLYVPYGLLSDLMGLSSEYHPATEQLFLTSQPRGD